MSDHVEPTGTQPELPRRGFMAKATAVTTALVTTPLLTRLASATSTVPTQPQKVGPGTPPQMAPKELKLGKPRLNLQIRVPQDVEVTTTIERVGHQHKFAEKLNGVMRTAKIDLTTPLAGSTLRDPGSIANDDTCCCVRG